MSNNVWTHCSHLFLWHWVVEQAGGQTLMWRTWDCWVTTPFFLSFFLFCLSFLCFLFCSFFLSLSPSLSPSLPPSKSLIKYQIVQENKFVTTVLHLQGDFSHGPMLLIYLPPSSEEHALCRTPDSRYLKKVELDQALNFQNKDYKT